MADRLTILFTNIWLDHYAGTEVVVRDLSLGAMRRGHRPIVYSPTAGAVAQELRARGVAVIEDLRMLAERPDIIHAHHAIPCGEALIRFPDVPAINVCHGFEAWVEAPAHFPQVGAYVAIDEGCRDRLIHTQGIDPARVLVLANAVDLKRVPERTRLLSERPQRALAFGKASAVPEIRAACEASSIAFEAIGYPAGRTSSHPEEHLVGFDLVFASCRAALESLCCGCAVIVCDHRGIAGMVTPENFSALRAANFGLRSFIAPVTHERLIENIRRYDRDDAVKVSERARREANLEGLLDDFDRLYTEVLSGPRRPAITKDAHDAAVARFLHDYLPRRPGDVARRLRADEQHTLRERTLGLHRQWAETTRELETLKRSRLLRLGRWFRGIGGARLR